MAECTQQVTLVERYIVVDDDRMNNLVSKFIIQKHNNTAEIQLYTDPELALTELLRISSNDDNRKTVVFLDINMPMMTGWEFLEHVNDLKPNTCKQFCIYMFSSSIDPSDIKRAKDHQLISGFFSKPLNAQHLEIVSSHIC